MVVAVVAALLIIAVVLRFKAEFVISFEMLNKNTKFVWQLKMFGGALMLPRKDKKIIDKKAETEEKKSIKETERMSFNEILELRSEILYITETVFEFIKNNVSINKFDTEIITALKDPFANGMAYGAVSGGANIIYGLVTGNFKIKNYHLDITGDFNSGIGISLKFNSVFGVRPVAGIFNLAKILILNKELRNNIKKVKQLFQKEEQ